MKRKLFALILAAVAAIAVQAQEQVTIASYNVRVLNGGDEAKGEVWARRCKAICDQMNFVSPDALGTQEVTYQQLTDMQKLLDRYGCIGVGRDDGKHGGEFMAIFYNKERLELLRHDTFWLSETPDKVSRGWDAVCNRVCTWGEFRDKRTKKRFFYFNTHLDHRGKVAQQESAKLILSKMSEIAKGRVAVLTGDFNVSPKSDTFAAFVNSGQLKDCCSNARYCFAECGTFQDYDPYRRPADRIDHVLVTPNVAVDGFAVLTDGYWVKNDAKPQTLSVNGAEIVVNGGKWVRHNPSDHYPVVAKLRF